MIVLPPILNIMSAIQNKFRTDVLLIFLPLFLLILFLAVLISEGKSDFILKEMTDFISNKIPGD